MTKVYGFVWDPHGENEIMLPTHVTHWIKGMTRATIEDHRASMTEADDQIAITELVFRQANMVRPKELAALSKEYGFDMDVSVTDFQERLRYEIIISNGEIKKNSCMECDYTLSSDENARILDGFTGAGGIRPESAQAASL